MFLPFDPLYLILALPGLLLAAWAQAKVKSAYANAQKYRAASGMTGAQAAKRILEAHGLGRVGIEPAQGFLGDHYDPRHRVLRLSPEVYGGRDLAAVGIAAHEAGHAIQHAHGYAPLQLRNAIVPLASTGSHLSIGMFTIGLMLSFVTGNSGLAGWLIVGGVALFAVVVLFQLINLPVEFDASSRARKVLVSNGVIAVAEEPEVGKVLNAAAMTYVAATVSAIITLLYLVLKSGLLGGSRDE
jgi:Zn-dependent membrane protease YugP